MWFISLILSVETSPGSNAVSIKANAFIVTHIKRTVLFSEVSEVTIIKEAKCYLWWTTKDFILETLFCQCILQTQFIILIKSLLAPTVAFLSFFFLQWFFSYSTNILTFTFPFDPLYQYKSLKQTDWGNMLFP